MEFAGCLHEPTVTSTTACVWTCPKRVVGDTANKSSTDCSLRTKGDERMAKNIPIKIGKLYWHRFWSMPFPHVLKSSYVRFKLQEIFH
jgi:hypothetical protein